MRNAARMEGAGQKIREKEKRTAATVLQEQGDEKGRKAKWK